MDDDSQGDVESVIPDSKVYACQHCTATFCRQYTLRRHEYTHTGKCAKRLTITAMSVYVWACLTLTLLIICVQHVRFSSGERPFWCHQCNVGFIQKYRLLHHTITYHGKWTYTWGIFALHYYFHELNQAVLAPQVLHRAQTKGRGQREKSMVKTRQQ